MNKLFVILVPAIFFAFQRIQEDKVVLFPKDIPIIGFNLSDFKRFDPSMSEFTLADSIIRLYIKAKSNLHPSESIQYPIYYKQVYGLIDRNNNKILFINCFAKLDGHYYWREKTVVVKGGGQDYFNFKFNLNSKSCFDYFINASK